TGPPKQVALNKDGSFTKAAAGFARSQGVNLNQLQLVSTAKGEYLGIKKTIKGKPTENILVHIIPSLIASLSFPKMMRWGEKSLRFSRPIHNILCLFDGKFLSFELDGIQSTALSRGHRLLSPEEKTVDSASFFLKFLRKNKVILDPEERRRVAQEMIASRMLELKAEMFPDEELLEKLLYDVEHPYIFVGRFPENYLKLPLEVLSTAMREGQRLFSITKRGIQLPFFIGIADTDKDVKGYIQKGNERVLKARLEDARFFWEQDLAVSLEERKDNLKKIIFQESLGSYEEKARRLVKITSYLAGKTGLVKEKKYLLKACELCKVDLLTEMVREFPSLQGKMGGLYAREEGYPSPVWKAIYGHYQPQSLEDEIPSTLHGSILSLADKVDNIIGILSSGTEISGSKDPFGLRRDAQGICKIILENKLSFSFPNLIDKSIKVYQVNLKMNSKEIKDYCLDFFRSRLQYLFEKEGYRYDLIKAALGPGIDNLYFSFLRLKSLNELKESSHFIPMILLAKRVNNILRDQAHYRISQDLLVEKQERELYSSLSIIKKNVVPILKKGGFAKAQKIIFRLRIPLDKFFDKVLVMTEDKKLRRNRLALLQEIQRLLFQVADYSQIVVQGDS
ncbi:MAG: glycine--tRNA ligase subunit beta, partial [Acidobacteriota bacterium]